MVFGVSFILAILILALFIPNPTPLQQLVFRIILSLAGAGIATMLPGFISVEVGTVIRASGAIAVFVLLYFFNPAPLVLDEDGPRDQCDVTDAWHMLQSHRGPITEAIDDCLAFQELILEIGCIQHPYTLDLAGKQNLGRFVITVLEQYSHTSSPGGTTYHYKDFVTSLEVGGEISNVAWRARKTMGSDEAWEILD